MNSTPRENSAPRRAIVLSFARLPLRLLGCYGSSLSQTPHLDRLAARGAVFHQYFADELDDSSPTLAWWTGGSTGDDSLAGRLRAAGVFTTLLSDDVESAAIPAAGFEQLIPVELASSGEVSLGPLLEVARTTIERLDADSSRWLLWIHSRELAELPLPPLEFLELYLDELIRDDAPPVSDEEPIPDLSQSQREEALARVAASIERLSSETTELDADDWQVLGVLAAACLSALDRAVGELLRELDRRFPGEEILFVLTARQGMSLGEEFAAGRLDAARWSRPLGEERCHLPLLIGGAVADDSTAIHALAQPADLAASLCDWFGAGETLGAGRSLWPVLRGETPVQCDVAVTTAGEWRALRDRDWLYLRHASGDERLFALPEDRWQVLDVREQYPDQTDRWRKLCETRESSARATEK